MKKVQLEGKTRKSYIEWTTTIHQKVDDGVVIKSVHVERKAVEFVFETQEELALFRSVLEKQQHLANGVVGQ